MRCGSVGKLLCTRPAVPHPTTLSLTPSAPPFPVPCPSLVWLHTGSNLPALLARAKSLTLPKNPLDDLIERLGGPDAVAEMTGRAKRMEAQPRGGYSYVSRSAQYGRCSLDDVSVCVVLVLVLCCYTMQAGGHSMGCAAATAAAAASDIRRLCCCCCCCCVCHHQVNILERNAFQCGAKRVAIISDAASAGISLHAGEE
jgi:hypothetical protein